MLGAIIGDVVGSIYEWENIKTKEFPLFKPECHFTDDTVMTIAVAEALMQGGSKEDYVVAMKKWGQKYPYAGYGSRFFIWLISEDNQAYNSWGNGSAMRVAPVGWFFKTLEETKENAKLSAIVTHNHPEGIKGAEATATAIFLARCKKTKAEIKNYIADHFNYNLSRTLDEIRPTYSFDESCQETVPEAIIAFLESTSFEDAIRNAISLGGDSDTLAAITGSIAEAFYGIPYEIERQAIAVLDSSIIEILNAWNKKLFEEQLKVGIPE